MSLPHNGSHEARARLTLGQSLKCARFKLWDEEGRRMVGFHEVAA